MSARARRGYSEYLSERDYERLNTSIRFADQIGCPLTECCTINWSRTRKGDDVEGKVLAWLMEQTRKWLKRQGILVFAWVAVRERPTQAPNDHIMVHCPAPLVQGLRKQFRKWVQREDKAGRLGADAPLGQGNPTLKAALGFGRYWSKGLEAETAKRLGVQHRDQGRVYGKRLRISQDISAVAQARHGAFRRAA